ncbi:MAG: tol-pal system protein YbgF [Acidobacteria bacterium]|nr:tol-pal system protein YbgF [Acidobacteriota bacterium]
MFSKTGLSVALAMLLAPLSGLGASKEIVRLQADMTLLQQQVRDLQKSFDTQNAVLQKLVEQLADQVNILKKSVEDVKGSNQQTQAAVSARVESVSSQFSAVNSGLDLVLERINKLSQQLAETKAKVEVLDTPSASASAPPRSGPPSPEELYNAAYGDFIKGSYDLARQGFEEYLKNYPDTELSDNAQYWVGECSYVQRKFAEAVQGFDRVLANYPRGDKAPAAALKKGYSLLEARNNEAGVRELRLLIQKYPNSDSAQLAKDRLNSMGVAVSDRSTPARRPGAR